MKTIRFISYSGLFVIMQQFCFNCLAADDGNYYSEGNNRPSQQYYYAINSSFFGRASFYVVSGLMTTIGVDSNGFQNQMKTQKKSNAINQVILSRGMFFDSQLFSSYISGNSVTPENLTIQLMDSDGNVSAAWELSNAYMVNYDISAGMQNDGIPVNSVTLAYGWMIRMQ